MKEYKIKNKVSKIMNKNRMRSPLARIVLASALTGFVVWDGGALLGKYLSKPVSIQSANLNGDKLSDLVITYKGGRIEERVQMPDGSYRIFTRADKEAVKREAKMNFYLENNIPFSSEDL